MANHNGNNGNSMVDAKQGAANTVTEIVYIQMSSTYLAKRMQEFNLAKHKEISSVVTKRHSHN